MSCQQVIIYNGLCTSYGTTLLHLEQNRKHLKENGIGYIRTGIAPFYGLASHENLSRQIQKIDTLDNWQRQQLADWMENIDADAEQYSALLLTVFCPWIDPLRQIRQTLRGLPHLRQARFRILMHVSSQEVMLEQILRMLGTRQGVEFWKDEWLHSDVHDLAHMAECLRAGYGRPNVAFIPGQSDPAASPTDADAERILYDMLQCPPPSTGTPLRCRLALRSRDARHIQSLYGQLNNTWPVEVTPRFLLEFLEKAESALSESDVLDYRSMFSSNEARKLREKCAMGNARLAAMYPATEVLSARSSHITEETQGVAWEPWQDLRRESAAALLSLASPDIRRGLLEALRTSEPILTQDQKTLLSVLGEECASPSLRPLPPRKAKVSVLMQTYNQAAYVAEAIESVLAQKTNFGVEIVVVDDASTDGTQKVVADYARRYANIRPIFLRRRSNAGQNTLALFRHARAPYAALCDGDDYFTDTDKLQIQADYLDANPECSLCFHYVRLVWEDGSPDVIYPDLANMVKRGKQARYHLKELMAANFIQTNSVMYRWRFSEGIPCWFNPVLVPGDWYWHLLHAELGYIGFIDRVMSVYRRHSQSLFWRPREASSIAHRLRFGIRELRTYQKVKEHFGKRGAEIIDDLASGVFADLVKHYMETNDDEPLNKAVRYFPEAAKDFLSKLDFVK